MDKNLFGIKSVGLGLEDRKHCLRGKNYPGRNSESGRLDSYQVL